MSAPQNPPHFSTMSAQILGKDLQSSSHLGFKPLYAFGSSPVRLSLAYLWSCSKKLPHISLKQVLNRLAATSLSYTCPRSVPNRKMFVICLLMDIWGDGHSQRLLSGFVRIFTTESRFMLKTDLISIIKTNAKRLSFYYTLNHLI